MKELTFMARYNQNWRIPWNQTLQVVRDSLEWDVDDGFTMSGTWRGRMPENGLYKFIGFTEAKNNDGANLLDSMDLPMFVTFNPDKTWNAIDYYYKQENNGTFTDNTDNVKSFDIGGLIHYSFIDHANWLVNDRTARFADTMMAKFDFFTTQQKVFEILKDDYYGFAGCFGGHWYTGRDIIARSTGNMYYFNALSMQTGEIEAQEILNRKANAGTLDDRVISFRTTYLNASSNNTAQTTEVGSTSSAQLGNRHSWADIIKGSRSGERKDFANNMEGTMGEFNGGIDRLLNPIERIVLNDIYDPRCGFTSQILTNSAITDGLVYHPKHIDFYKGTTELFAVTYQKNRNS